MPTGFASLSKERRAELGRKGGRRAHQGRTVHRFNGFEAQMASSKGNDAKKAKAAARAKVVLLAEGFTDAQLAKLTVDGLIYFGGSRRSPSRMAALRERFGV